MSAQKQIFIEQVSNINLENPQVSIVKSMAFMKRLTVASISLITYLRGLFPQEAYWKKKLDGQTVYFLRGIDDVPGTKTLIGWVNNAFELVESHHLRKMIFVIRKELTTVETYTISFSYDHDAINYYVLQEIDGMEVLSQHSPGVPGDIAKAVRQMIRSIFVHVSALDPLPSDCHISFSIVLDDDTPKEMIPENFQGWPSDKTLDFLPEIENLKFGEVVTKYATFAVSTKSILNQESCINGAANQEQEMAEVDVEDEVSGSQVDNDQMTSVLNSAQIAPNCHTVEKSFENNSRSSNLSERLSMMSMRAEQVVSCICECNIISDDTIKCVSCSMLQHKTCYKMLDCHQEKSHICVACHDPSKGQVCSVPELLSDTNRKEMALYRQALVYCFNNTEMSCKRLMTHLNVPRRVAEKMLHRLKTEECLVADPDKRYTYHPNIDVKDNVFNRYFKVPTDEETNLDTQHSKRQLSQEYESLSQELQAKRQRILQPSPN